MSLTGILYSILVAIFDFGDLFAVTFDALEEDFNVVMSVDHFITEEGDNPAVRQGQDPKLIGRLILSQSLMTNGKAKNDPTFHGFQGQVLTWNGFCVCWIQ